MFTAHSQQGSHISEFNRGRAIPTQKQDSSARNHKHRHDVLLPSSVANSFCQAAAKAGAHEEESVAAEADWAEVVAGLRGQKHISQNAVRVSRAITKVQVRTAEAGLPAPCAICKHKQFAHIAT